MIAHEFFEQLSGQDLRLNIPLEQTENSATLSNEALFQIPLLAMTILVISKGNSKPQLSELGQLVGECLERTVAGFKGSSQNIGWSGNLRIRTIKALTFLEVTNQIKVDENTKRIAATDFGKKVYENAIFGDGPLATAMKTIEQSYQYIRDESRIGREVN
jgi:hypothetical protein